MLPKRAFSIIFIEVLMNIIYCDELVIKGKYSMKSKIKNFDCNFHIRILVKIIILEMNDARRGKLGVFIGDICTNTARLLTLNRMIAY